MLYMGTKLAATASLSLSVRAITIKVIHDAPEVRSRKMINCAFAVDEVRDRAKACNGRGHLYLQGHLQF